jgi:hypothetical protein
LIRSFILPLSAFCPLLGLLHPIDIADSEKITDSLVDSVSGVNRLNWMFVRLTDPGAALHTFLNQQIGKSFSTRFTLPIYSRRIAIKGRVTIIVARTVRLSV